MKIYAAPMEGVTGYVYRNAHRHHFRGIDTYYTPFLTPKKGKGWTSREKNDICLASNIISSSHGVFLKTADGISYTDLNSRNGTYVESRKGRALLKNTKQAVALYSGDMIRILSRKHPESSVLIIYEDEQQENRDNDPAGQHPSRGRT